MEVKKEKSSQNVKNPCTEVFITLKTTGIIVEYNPLHPGHIYHMEQTRKQTGADYLIAAMSGSFVQRGAPALLDGENIDLAAWLS